MPTNNVSSGNIAGTKAAGDDPPVRKKKIYTGEEVLVECGCRNG